MNCKSGNKLEMSIILKVFLFKLMVWKNLKSLFHQNNHLSLLAMRNFFRKMSLIVLDVFMVIADDS